MKKNTKALLLLTVTFGLGLPLAQGEEAKTLWEKHCASCHGKDGKGETKMGRQAGVKNYTDPKFQEEFKEERAIKTIKDGLTEKGKERMKPYADKLTDDEIKSLAAYIRTFQKQ